MVRQKPQKRDEAVIFFAAYITLKNGKRLYAKDYGYKAWPLKIRKPKR